MFCGACARDVVLFRGTMNRGHDLTVIQLYTPLRLEDNLLLQDAPVLLGGVNAYLQQLSPLFRRTPEWFDRLLDRPAVLRLASRFAVRTQPEELGPMTVSVLKGAAGNQAKEVGKLIRAIREMPKPDIICITNTLLSGLAPTLKKEFGVPIVCGVQGEDYFVEAMPERYCSEAKHLMHANIKSIDLLLAPCDATARLMREFLDLPCSKMVVARPGFNVETYRTTSASSQRAPVIGYLSAITPRKGLDLLVTAFAKLHKNGADVQLHVAGQTLSSRYLKSIDSQIRQNGLAGVFHTSGELNLKDKIDFMQQCAVFCVPSRISESRGQAVMEALAAGAPVVAPDTGVYPELAATTGAVELFKSGDADALAMALNRVLTNRDEFEFRAANAVKIMAERHSADQMVETFLAECHSLVESGIRP